MDLGFPYLFSYSDVFFVPLSFLLIFAFTYRTAAKYNNTELKKYFYPALMLRLVVTIIYSVIIQFYYGGQADTNVYYRGVLDMHAAVEQNPSVLKDIYGNLELTEDNPVVTEMMYDPTGGYTYFVMRESKNWMVSKCGLVLSLIFNKNYLAISLFLSVFAFAGCWRMFKGFYTLYPHLKTKIALACLFLPSIIFWGVGLIKDSICIGGLGFLFYSLINIFITRRKVLISVLIALASAWLIYNVKPYILLCFAPAFLIWIFIRFNRTIPDKTLRSIAAVLFTGIALVAGVFLIQYMTSQEESSKFAADNLVQTVQSQQYGYTTAQGQGSAFTVGKVGSGFGSLLLLFPAGVVASLYRPFPWDVRSPLMVLSAIEAMAFIFLTYSAFKKIGFFKTFGMIFSDPLTLFCFVYAILFAGFVGITTSNFGALVRYKIPCLPFYLMMLFIVMDNSGKFSPKYIFSKKYF